MGSQTSPSIQDLQGIKPQWYIKQAVSHHLSFTAGEGEAPGEVAGFESHSEHSEQGSEHWSHCASSATQVRVLPLCSPRQGAAPPARDAAPGGDSAAPARDAAGAPQTSAAAAACRGRTVVTLAGEQQEPGRLKPSRWNPLSPADTRAVPGHTREHVLPPACRQSPSTGRDSPHGGPGQERLLPARLCPPASQPGRGLTPASPF